MAIRHFEDNLSSWRLRASSWQAGDVFAFIRPETSAQARQLENLQVRADDVAVFMALSDTDVMTMLVAGKPVLYPVTVVPLLRLASHVPEECIRPESVSWESRSTSRTR